MARKIDYSHWDKLNLSDSDDEAPPPKAVASPSDFFPGGSVSPGLMQVGSGMAAVRPPNADDDDDGKVDLQGLDSHQLVLARTVEALLRSEPGERKRLRALLGLRRSVRTAAALHPRRGLPHTAAALRAAADGGRQVRVCYVGGSITEQRAGYRPRVHEWLNQRFPTLMGHKAVSASMGNVGSKVLSFLVEDWVTCHEPDIVFLETVVNDGDSVLESGDEAGVRRAVEGIVRQIKAHSPHTEVVLLYMFLRGDLPSERRTGTMAWVNGGVPGDATVYHHQVPALLESIAEHYGLPSMSLIEPLAGLPRAALDTIFRDDCHHTPVGAAFVASIVAEGLELCLDTTMTTTTPPPLPPVMDTAHWMGGHARRVSQADLTFAGGMCTANHMRADRDPISAQPGDWWLLDPKDVLTVKFRGIGLGLLTYVGPDSGLVRCEVMRDDGGVQEPHTSAHALFDKWCYYYRLSVAMLCEGLPLGEYTARIWLDPVVPNREFTRHPAPPGVQGALKLWLSYYLVMGGTWADQSLALASVPSSSATALRLPAFEGTPGGGGVAAAVVAPLKHEDDLLRRKQGLAGRAFGPTTEGDAYANDDDDDAAAACAACGTRGAELSLLRCSRCKGASYCGTECQRGHWPTHRSECKPVRTETT